jgi:hypothetical protein
MAQWTWNAVCEFLTPIEHSPQNIKVDSDEELQRNDETTRSEEAKTGKQN